MTRDEVIRGLECCAAGCVNSCPYADEPAHCTDYLAQDALELLKDGEHPDFSGSLLNRDDYVRIGDVMDCLSEVFIPRDDLIHIEGLIEWAMGKRAGAMRAILSLGVDSAR